MTTLRRFTRKIEICLCDCLEKFARNFITSTKTKSLEIFSFRSLRADRSCQMRTKLWLTLGWVKAYWSVER